MIALHTLSKQQIKTEFQLASNDTGSPEVQVALITSRVLQITRHLQANPKDFDGRRGLLILIGQRNRLLSYLKRKSHDRYLPLISKLGLKDRY